MTKLLDFIFNNIQEKELDRSQIVDYIRYLDELIEGGLPLEKELVYQGIKIKLTKRLNDLNQQQIQSLQKIKKIKEKEKKAK